MRKIFLLDFYAKTYCPEHVLLIKTLCPFLKISASTVEISLKLFDNEILFFGYICFLFLSLLIRVYLTRYMLLFASVKHFFLMILIWTFSEDKYNDINFLMSIIQFYNFNFLMLSIVNFYIEI